MDMKQKKEVLEVLLSNMFGAWACKIDNNGLVILKYTAKIRGIVTDECIEIQFPFTKEEQRVWEALSPALFTQIVSSAGFSNAEHLSTGLAIPIDEAWLFRRNISRRLDTIFRSIVALTNEVLSSLSEEYIRAYLTTKAIKKESEEED